MSVHSFSILGQPEKTPPESGGVITIFEQAD
jgi:hypothetical protein